MCVTIWTTCDYQYLSLSNESYLAPHQGKEEFVGERRADKAGQADGPVAGVFPEAGHHNLVIGREPDPHPHRVGPHKARPGLLRAGAQIAGVELRPGKLAVGEAARHQLVITTPVQCKGDV